MAVAYETARRIAEDPVYQTAALPDLELNRETGRYVGLHEIITARMRQLGRYDTESVLHAVFSQDIPAVWYLVGGEEPLWQQALGYEDRVEYALVYSGGIILHDADFLYSAEVDSPSLGDTS